MMRTQITILVTGILLLFCPQIYSQYAQLQGKVIDEEEKPLIGVNVYLQGTILGSATDSEGEFMIEKIPSGDFKMTVSMIGYQQKDFPISIEKPKLYDAGTIQLTPSALSGEPIVVTAGKYEQKVQDVAASLSTLSQKDLQYRNSITVKDALQFVSGVNLNGGQINIRGSSGYSQGVGSRVLFLLDGTPFLTGDTRDIIYESIPPILIERVEVLKGAGSALYGSSALGGVINVITRDIDSAPGYYLKSYAGMYTKPAYDQWNFIDENRFMNGQVASFAQQLNKLGFQIGVTRDEDDSYRQNDWLKRWSGSSKLEWEISPFQQLTLTGNYMRQKRGNFLYWRDLNNALQPPINQVDDVVISNRYYLTGQYRHVFSPTRFLTARGIWFWNRFEDTVTGENGSISTSKNMNGEVQFNTQLGQLFLTAGIEATYNTADSDLFGDRTGIGSAAYIQSEISLSRKLKTTLGTRLDYFDIDSVDADARVNPKLGVVYKPMKGTAIRASSGLGFRAPSMAEVFTSTNAGGLQVIPNNELKPEKSIYGEIGANQLIGRWLMLDVAGFYSRFEDLIEGVILNTGQIQFQNITEARVQGAEIKLNGRFFNQQLNAGIGYTYVDPWDLEEEQFLNFRPRHVLTSNATYQFNMFQVGVDYRFISRYDRIDNRFSLIVNDAEERVPVHVVDLRLSADIHLAGNPLNVSFQVNNLLNYHYVDLVGAMAPLRHFVVTMETGL